MLKKKFYKLVWIVLFIIVVLPSCLNDSDTQFDMVGDMYVIKKMINDEIQYAPTYYVFANLGMTSATVTLPNDGGTIDLEGTSGGLTYIIEPTEDSDFSTTAPEEGSYLFEATSTKGETLTMSDEFQLDNLSIPEFDNINFSSSSILEVSWSSVSGADGYYIKILDANGDDVYTSYTIDSSTNEYTISEEENTGSWELSPSTGETYTIQINVFSYDSDATTSNSGYNVEELAIGESQITWE